MQYHFHPRGKFRAKTVAINCTSLVIEELVRNHKTSWLYGNDYRDILRPNHGKITIAAITVYKGSTCTVCVISDNKFYQKVFFDNICGQLIARSTKLILDHAFRA